MQKPKGCPHNELMERFFERDRHTGELIVKFYRCIDCGKNIVASKVITIPPSKGCRRVFVIQDE